MPKGAYTMQGAYEASTGRIKLKQVEWINQPFGYFMVDLEGRMEPKGDVLAGIVPAAGCEAFRLFRQREKVS